MTRRPAQEGTARIPGKLHEPDDCRAISEVLSRVGDKWTVLVVETLGPGPKRFNELRRALGSISQRMLTLTLRALERDGLVTRTQSEADRRCIGLTLTEDGQRTLRRVRSRRTAYLASRLAALKPVELMAVGAAAEALAGLLEGEKVRT